MFIIILMGEKNRARLKISRTKDKSRAREKKGAPKEKSRPKDKKSRQGKKNRTRGKKVCIFDTMSILAHVCCTNL